MPRARRRWGLVRMGHGDNAMLWKEMAVEAGAWRLGVMGRLAVFLLSLLVIVPSVIAVAQASAYVSSGRHPWQLNQLVTTSVLASLGCLILIAARGAGCITGEKERDCWVSLVSTPLAGREIVLGKLAGTLWSSRWVGIVLCFVWACCLLIDQGFLVALPFAAGTYLLLAVYAALLGMFFSARTRNTLRAMGLTLLVGIIGGGGYLFCCAVFMFNSGPGNEATIILAPCIPFLLAFPGIVYSEGFGRNSEILLAAYVLGMIGYLIVSAGLLAYLINNFDELAGRISGRPTGPAPPRPRAQPDEPQPPSNAANRGPSQE